MNMKKTLAALSAAAVAVSAMATTVSAEEGSFTYDLVRETKTIEDGTATIATVASGLNLTAATDLKVTMNNSDANKFKAGEAVYTITVTQNGTNQVWTKEISSKTDAANYSTWISVTGDTAVITIPCASGATTGGIDTAVFDTSVRVQIVATTKHDVKDDSQKKFNAAIAAGTISTQFEAVSAANTAELALINADIATVNAMVLGTDVTGTTLTATGAPATAGMTALTADEKTSLNTALVALKNAIQVNVAPQIASTNAGEKAHLFPMMTTVNGIARPVVSTGLVAINADGKNAANDSYDLISSTSSTATQFDLIDYLELNNGDLNDKIGKVGYKNVLPVLNDVIASYEDVTFTFTTSALYVNVDARDNNTVSYLKKDDDKAFGEGFSEKKDDYWYNPSFGQHLYGKDYYDAEGTNYVGTNSNWAFNLFTGGLTINNKYTMSLNDTQVFDWGENTLSFDWDSVSEGKVTNARYILEYMNLYTSTPWFWDSMTVSFSDGKAEDAESGEGVEGEEEVVEDETSEEVTEEVTEEEAPVVDDATAENPETGNASVALAVIPVALAAAAIVAKKRG